jgi:hypothetical protein
LGVSLENEEEEEWRRKESVPGWYFLWNPTPREESSVGHVHYLLFSKRKKENKRSYGRLNLDDSPPPTLIENFFFILLFSNESGGGHEAEG